MSFNDLQNIFVLCAIVMLMCVITYVKNPIITLSIDFRDIIVFSGIALIGIGTYMIHQPAAFIVCGAMLFWLGRPR